MSVLIQAAVVEKALTIPKEALRREQGQAGVYVLNGDRLEWRTVTQGINTTRTQVTGTEGGRLGCASRTRHSKAEWWSSRCFSSAIGQAAKTFRKRLLRMKTIRRTIDGP